MDFNPADYGVAFAAAMPPDRRRPLDEGRPNLDLRGVLEGLDLQTAFAGHSIADPKLAQSCLSGVWLLNDFLDESHTISQSIPTSEGSFWHGIMHRREGDFSNAKYWFRRVGDHPVYEQLAERFGEWDPFAFVDNCQSALRGGADAEECLDKQQAEWEFLFEWCYRGATA